MKLKFPVTYKGSEIEVLEMRRPKVRDMLIADKAGSSDAEREIAMFSNLCDVDMELIEDLDLMDYTNLQKGYRDFLS